MSSAARAGMQQFPMTDPAWRLFEDIWKASNKLALMTDPPPNRPGSTRARRNEDGEFTRMGLKVPGINWSGHGKPGYKPQGFNVEAARRWREEHGSGVKCTGQKHGDEYAMTRGPVDGTKHGGDCFSDPKLQAYQTSQDGSTGADISGLRGSSRTYFS